MPRMATEAQTVVPNQLHVKLSDRDARKLARLAKAADLCVSDAIRAMIRSTSAIEAPTITKGS